MRHLVIGCGYLGQRVAALWRDAGHEVVALTRDSGRQAEFDKLGLRAVVGDVTQPATLAPLGDAPVDTLLYAVGYDRAAAPSIQQVYADGLRNVLQALTAQTRRVLYISTTGVYGPAGGDWVDEQTPANPLRDGGLASLAAEQALHESRFADRGVALRLAGIYGPGRVPFLQLLAGGEPIPAPANGWLNLIHVDDAARIVEQAAVVENVSQLYCVSDGQPVQRGDYYREVARLVGADPPRFVAPEPDSPRAARAAADKRVSNRRLVAELETPFRYPSYREGLAGILGNPRPNG